MATPGERLKRKTKPTTKSVDSRIQTDNAKLDNLWAKVQKAITELQNAPNSADKIGESISQVRTHYNVYNDAWLHFADYLTSVSTPECLQEHHRLQAVMGNRKQFVHENITQGNDRKQDILME